MTPRTLRNWKNADPAAPRLRPGRPPLSEDELARARDLVRSQLEAQGWTAGEEPVWRALDGALPRARVRRVLAELKAERRRELAAREAELRVSTTVLLRDAVWALDATHLGRDADGEDIQAEVLREVASTRTIEVSVGAPACAADVVALLDAAVHVRDTAPLVLVTDNGSPYTSELVEAWCTLHGVVHLLNLPRTPRHNPCAEHGMRELKEEAALGKGVLLHDPLEALTRLDAARRALDEGRLRATRGWRTAAEDDAQRTPWSQVLDRATLLEKVSCAIQKALVDCTSSRARRLATRAAILTTLDELHVTQRTRGGRPWTAQFAEDVS